MKTGLIWKEWRQNVWVFVAFIILVIGYGQFETYQTINNHNSSQIYYSSTEFKNIQKEQDKESRMTAEDIQSTLTLDVYTNTIINIFSLVLVFFMGLKITVFEKNKRADYIAQAMPYSKFTIISHKLFWPLIVIIVPSVVYFVASYLMLNTHIDAQYMFTLKNWITNSTNSLLFLLIIFSFSFMMGTLIGDVVVAVAATGALLASSVLLFVGSIRFTLIGFYAYFNNTTIEKIYDKPIVSLWFNKGPYIGYTLVGLFVLIFLILGCIFYSKASLENNGLMLTLPKARMPILIIGALYTALTLANLNIGQDNRVSDAMVKTYLLHFGLIAFIAFAIGWVLFYKVKKLRRI